MSRCCVHTPSSYYEPTIRRAGVKVDDLVVSLGGEKIGTIRDYQTALDKLTPEEETIVVVKRGLELLRLPITPIPRQPK